MRSLNFENLKDTSQVRPPLREGFEQKIVEAIDMKYHRHCLDEERKRDLMEWMEYGLPVRDLAAVLGRGKSTIYRWLGQIKADIC